MRKLVFEGIVKVQTPLFQSGGAGLALVYDQKRKHMKQFPVEQVQAKMQGEAKKFFYGKIYTDKVVLDKEAPYQDW